MSNVDYTLQHRIWAKEYTKVYKARGRQAAGKYLVENVPEEEWSNLREFNEREFEKQGVQP